MLFYRGIKIYYRMDRIANKMFVVSVDKGDKRFFLNFTSSHSFETWYGKLPDGEKTINEIIMTDRRKLIVDIDDDPHADLSLFDFERHVKSRIHEVFANMDIGSPEVIMYKMTNEHGDEEKLSYHAVVSNFSFDARTCMGLCVIISSGQVWDNCVDIGIYKSVQSIRVEGSTKFGTNSWKRACSMASFQQGLISNISGTTYSSFSCALSGRVPRVYNVGHVADMSQFKIGKTRGSYVPLYRTKPGYCKQCDRVHDRENAAIMYRMGEPTFVCWRFTAAAIRLPAASS